MLKKLLSSEHPRFKRLLVLGDELQEDPDSSSGMCMRRGWDQALFRRNERKMLGKLRQEA